MFFACLKVSAFANSSSTSLSQADDDEGRELTLYYYLYLLQYRVCEEKAHRFVGAARNDCDDASDIFYIDIKDFYLFTKYPFPSNFSLDN